MNLVALTGRLTRDPDIKYANDNTVVANFSIAVQRNFRDKESGQYEADFIDCKAFKNKAEFLEKYAKKGTKLEVTGEMRRDEWEREGSKHSRIVVYVQNVGFAESKSAASGNTGETSSHAVQKGSQQIGQAIDGFMNIPDDADTELPFN